MNKYTFLLMLAGFFLQSCIDQRIIPKDNGLIIDLVKIRDNGNSISDLYSDLSFVQFESPVNNELDKVDQIQFLNSG